MVNSPTDDHAPAWIDYLSRPFVRDGDLAGLIDDGIVGVTSNPTIFQAAIAEGHSYDEQLHEVLASETDPKEVFLALARDDIHAACDLLRPVLSEARRPATAGSHSKSTPTSPTTPRPPQRRPGDCAP